MIEPGKTPTAPPEEPSRENSLDGQADLELLRGILGGFDRVVGKYSLCGILQFLGCQTSRREIDRAIARFPHLRTNKDGPFYVFSAEDVRDYYLALSKVSLSEAIRKRRRLGVHADEPWRPDSHFVRSLGSLYVATEYSVPRKIYVPLFGRDGALLATNFANRSIQWIEPATSGGRPWELIRFTRGLERHPKDPIKGKVNARAVVKYEPHPYYSYHCVTKDGRVTFAKVPAGEYGADHLDPLDMVSAVFPYNWPNRAQIASYVLKANSPCWLTEWTHGLFVGIGTLDPEPRTRTQREIAILARANRRKGNWHAS